MKNYKAIFERLRENKVPDDLIVEIQELFMEIKNEAENYLSQLLDARHKLIKQDALIENQKNTLHQTREILESLTIQRDSMKRLLLEAWKEEEAKEWR